MLIANSRTANCLTVEMTWGETASHNVKFYEKRSKQGRCFALTSNGRMKVGLLARVHVYLVFDTSGALFNLLKF